MAARLSTCAAIIAVVHPSPALAYRPFDSTDASVVGAHEFELEFGVGYTREDAEESLTLPAVVANYGIDGDREIVLEGRIFTTLDAEDDAELDDAALSLKQVHRAGSLQERSGISVASECGILLPTTHTEDGIGAACALIASQRWQSATIHASAGVAVNRDHRWEESLGTILEGPDGWLVRPVSEVTFEWDETQSAARSALVGLIWRAREMLSFDAAVRYTRIGQSHDWEVRAGFTWAR